MDEKHNPGKHYEFENAFFREPRQCGDVSLLQAGELCCERGFEVEPHIQVCSEISCILSGEGSFYVNGIELPVREGDIVVNRRGETHTIRSSENQQLRYLYLGFEVTADSSPLAPVREFFHSPSPERVRRDRFSVAGLMMRLLDEFYGGGECSDTMIRDYIEQVLVLTCRTFRLSGAVRPFPTQDAGAVGGTVYSVIRYIDSNLLEIDSVQSIAAALGYSCSYLSHLFRSRAGMTLQSYFNGKRIEKGIELIGMGRLSITQIALRLNYDTVQSFSKAFKRTLGCSPAAYRRQCAVQRAERAGVSDVPALDAGETNMEGGDRNAHLV